MKKRITQIAAMVIALTLLLLCVGCGSSPVDDFIAADQTPTEDYRLEINDARMEKDSEGNDVILVTYILTNVSDEQAGNFIMETTHAAYQNGTQLEEAHLLEDLSYNLAETQVKDIAIGETAVVEVAYKLILSGVDVDVEFSSRTGGQKLTKSFLVA